MPKGMKNMRTLLLMIFAALSLSVSAQTITLNGNVKDTTGEPIIGASIVEKGNTTNGTITNLDGNFSLKVPANATVVISYIGMKTQEIAIKGKSKIDVTLSDDAKALDEVVVIGYGTAKRKDITGSVASVNSETLAAIPVASATEALQGKMAGVQITTTEGSPDAQMSIRVRGGGSITQSNEPLFIVDGFPVESISDIPPTDIESIDVLKDASSTAIYGARGANGVIIVTTKSGKEGKVSVSYNAYYAWKKVAKTLDVLSASDYTKWQYELAQLTNKNDDYIKYFGNYQDLDMYDNVATNDWQDLTFGRTGHSFNHNLSTNGGSDKFKYSFSYSHIDDKAIMQMSDYARDNLNLKLNHKPLKNVSLDFSARFSKTKINGGGSNDANSSLNTDKRLKYSLLYTPYPVPGISDALNADEEDANSLLINPLISLRDNDTRKERINYNLAGSITWEIIKDLKLKEEVGYDDYRNNADRYYGVTTYYVRNNVDDEDKSKPAISFTRGTRTAFRSTNTLSYDFKKFFKNNKNHLNLLAGQEYIVTRERELRNVVHGFPTEYTADDCINYSTKGNPYEVTNYGYPDDVLFSFFGRANYDFDSKYLFSATFRADGSSKFTKGNRWGYFPAAAFAWRIIEEPFMEPVKEFMSNLKLRLSYGTAGNNRIGNSLYETSYKAYSSGKYYGAGGEQNPHYTLNNEQLANPDLKWETTITRNIGLDFGFFNERLTGNIDYYWNTVKDLLIEQSITAIGYKTMQQNIGQTSNRGVELTLNAAVLQKKDYSLNFNFNIGFNKNKVDKLANGISSMSYNSGAFSSDMRGRDDYRVIVGEPLGIVWGYVYDGVYGVDDFVTYTDENGKTQFQFDKSGNYILKEGVTDNTYTTASSYGGLRPGAMKLKDQDGDHKITEKGDRVIIGRTQPKFTGGFGLSGNYKWFDISANFNFVVGNDVYNMDKMVSSQSYRNSYANLRAEMAPVTLGGKAWTYLDQSNGTIITDYETLKAMNANASYWSAATMSDNNPVPTSWAVEDGSFLRLQNLTVGFTLPKDWTKKFACNQFRLYCTLNNLFCLTGYDGYDPEVNSAIRNSKTSGVTPGADFSAYPKSFSWTAGVNITF